MVSYDNENLLGNLKSGIENLDLHFSRIKMLIKGIQKESVTIFVIQWEW